MNKRKALLMYEDDLRRSIRDKSVCVCVISIVRALQSKSNWQTTDLIRRVQRREERKKGSNREVRREIKARRERTNQMRSWVKKPKCVFIPLGRSREEERAGLLMHCSQQRERALRYHSVSQTQSPRMHTQTHKHTNALKIDANMSGWIQPSEWILKLLICLSSALRPIICHVLGLHN